MKGAGLLNGASQSFAEFRQVRRDQDTTGELSAPPIGPEVDLRSFAWLPIDVHAVRDGPLALALDPEPFRCAIRAQCVAWHQVPAGSLPADDAALAQLLGFGRDAKAWQAVRAAGALQGWVLCADGRLYLPSLAETARDAWTRKESQKARTAAATQARRDRRELQLMQGPTGGKAT